MRAPRGHSYVRGMTEIANMGSSPTLQARPSSAAWLRIMALVYDPFVWLGEMAGMRRRRNTLVGGAYGRVVEIGVGTGLNVAHYPDDIAESVAFMASSKASKTTGCMITVDGGVPAAFTR